MLIANPYILLQHTLFQTVNSVCFEKLKKKLYLWQRQIGGGFKR